MPEEGFARLSVEERTPRELRRTLVGLELNIAELSTRIIKAIEQGNLSDHDLGEINSLTSQVIGIKEKIDDFQPVAQSAVTALAQKFNELNAKYNKPITPSGTVELLKEPLTLEERYAEVINKANSLVYDYRNSSSQINDRVQIANMVENIKRELEGAYQYYTASGSAAVAPNIGDMTPEQEVDMLIRLLDSKIRDLRSSN